MTVAYSNQVLSRNDVALYIRDEAGNIVNPESVSYTIFDFAGQQRSGSNLPGMLNPDGSYYIAFYTNGLSGPLYVDWTIRAYSRVRTVRQNLFIIDPSNFVNGQSVKPIESSISKTFISGSTLGPNDLAIYFKNEFGLAENPFSVHYTINLGNSVIVPRTEATNAGIGHYYANQLISGNTGSYLIMWDWMDTVVDPLASASMPFNIICPVNLSVSTDCNCDCRCDCNMPVCGCLCVCQKVNVKFESNWCQNGC